jgi:choline transporter-like protein 2/4/5
VLGVIGGLGFAAYFCIMKYINISASSTSTSSTIQFKLDINYYLSLSITWLVFACIIVVVLLIVLVLLVFLVKRIRLAIQLIKEASKAVAQMFVTLLFPVVPMALQLALLAYSVTVAVILAASGKSLFRVATTNTTNASTTTNGSSLAGSLCDPNNPVYGSTCKFYNFGYDSSQVYASVMGFFYEYQFLPQLYNLFMFFWLQAFIVGLNQMILAGSFGTWYWSKDHARCSLFVSIKDALVYHLGSVAFGNFCVI